MSRIMLLLTLAITLAITIAAHPLGSDLVAKSSGSDLVASFLEDGKDVSSDRLPWLKLLGETSSVDDDHARGKPAHRERISSAKKPGIDELESRMTADGKSQDKWGSKRRRRHSHSPHSHSPHSHTPAPTNSWESSTVSAVADLTELQLAAWHATNAYNECSLSFTGHADGYSATASDCYDDTAQQSASLRPISRQNGAWSATGSQLSKKLSWTPLSRSRKMPGTQPPTRIMASWRTRASSATWPLMAAPWWWRSADRRRAIGSRIF